MRNDKNIPEKIFGVIVFILWLIIWKPISIVFKYLCKLLSEVLKGIHKNLVKWLSLLGFVVIISLIAYFVKFFAKS